MDLIHYFYKAYMALDEVILGGEIMESSKQHVLQQMEQMDSQN